jgi:hypothetical protein
VDSVISQRARLFILPLPVGVDGGVIR